jgi:cysteinyl-tRNA synthetase, unknown class
VITRHATALLAGAAALACAGAASLAPSLAEPPVAATAQAPTQPIDAAAERRGRLGAVDNWGYWLSSFEVAGVAAAPHDLMVVDSEISDGRTFERDYLPDEVARMRARPDGGARILLAYLSIGEAERYRPYWREDWNETAKKPAWLDKENRRWRGNFAVQFWQGEWQRLIFGTPESHLDRILAQGFDGVY